MALLRQVLQTRSRLWCCKLVTRRVIEFKNSLHTLQIWQSGCESTSVGGGAGEENLQRGDQASSTVHVEHRTGTQRLLECLHFYPLKKAVLMFLPEWQACQALFPRPQAICQQQQAQIR